MNPELLDFIKATVPSVWALELLLLLRGNRDDPWTSVTAARELRSNANYLGELLEHFRAAGLVERLGDSYRYSPASGKIEELATKLEEVYRERPVGVISAIVSAQRDKVQTFADAFRFREAPKK